MKYVYASRHGKTEKLVQALGLDAVKLEEGTAAMSEDFIIFTYTDGKGIVPKIVEDYLKTCGDKLKGVVATGNMERHADTYCWAGDIIAKDYNVPCLGKLEGEGTDEEKASLKQALGL